MTRDVVIAMDPATRTGWAVLGLDGRRVASGTWTLAPRKGRSKADRWVRFSRALSELMRAYEDRVAIVAVEQPFSAKRRGEKQNIANPSVAWGLVALAEYQAEARGLASIRIAPKTAKKVAAGSGNATKLQVAKAINRRHGLQLAAGDEADAIAVGEAALARLDLEALACGELVERSAA